MIVRTPVTRRIPNAIGLARMPVRRRGMGTVYGGPCGWSDDYCNSSWSLLNPLSAVCCASVDAQNFAAGARGLFSQASDAVTGYQLPTIKPPVTIRPPTPEETAGGDPNLPARLSNEAMWSTIFQNSRDLTADAPACAGLFSFLTDGCPGSTAAGITLAIAAALALYGVAKR